MQKSACKFGWLQIIYYLSTRLENIVLMRKLLFLLFHGFDPNNGISKKISYQVDALKACGMETHLCYMEENGSKKRLVDGTVIADYGNGIMSKILKRAEFSSIYKYAKDNGIEIVYTAENCDLSSSFRSGASFSASLGSASFKFCSSLPIHRHMKIFPSSRKVILSSPNGWSSVTP